MSKKQLDDEKRIYFLAVPIGNVKDISLRAIDCLEKAQLIFCEDTRKCLDLLKRANICSEAKIKTLTSYMEVSMDWDRFFSGLSERTLVYLSDAGTPIVNDPGRLFLQEAESRGWSCTAVPGACAPIVAIQRSGAFGLPFAFHGFVPKKNKGSFFRYVDSVKSFIFFDTKHSAKSTLEYLLANDFSERRLIVCRELTKDFEEVFRGNVEEGLEWVLQKLKGAGVGELTFILEGRSELSQNSDLELVFSLLEAKNTRDQARLMALLTGASKKLCYERLLKT